MNYHASNSDPDSGIIVIKATATDPLNPHSSMQLKSIVYGGVIGNTRCWDCKDQPCVDQALPEKCWYDSGG